MTQDENTIIAFVDPTPAALILVIGLEIGSMGWVGVRGGRWWRRDWTQVDCVGGVFEVDCPSGHFVFFWLCVFVELRQFFAGFELDFDRRPLPLAISADGQPSFGFAGKHGRELSLPGLQIAKHIRQVRRTRVFLDREKENSSGRIVTNHPSFPNRPPSTRPIANPGQKRIWLYSRVGQRLKMGAPLFPGFDFHFRSNCPTLKVQTLPGSQPYQFWIRRPNKTFTPLPSLTS